MTHFFCFFAHFYPLFCKKSPFLFVSYFGLCLFNEHKTRHCMIQEGNDPGATQKNRPKIKGGNPFASGFIPNGKRKNKGASYLTKKSLLKHMLEVDLTIQDLPTRLADELRLMLPGWFESVEKKFTMRQIMELVQFQLLFSKSDYVKQDAIDAIKDRVDGKAVQKMQFETIDPDPTEIVLPSGRKIVI